MALPQGSADPGGGKAVAEEVRSVPQEGSPEPGRPPLVSVVMPARDEEEHIEVAVRSVLAQSVDDLEVIVVDGMSTDGTCAVVRAMAAEDRRVRLVSNPDRTIPHGLNLGLRAARGQFLSRCDAHAVLNQGYLAHAVELLRSDPTVGSVGGRRLGTAQSPSGRAVATALSSRFGVGDAFYHYGEQASDSDHATFGVLRVEVLRSLGGWDERLLVNEDVDLDHRVRAAGYRIRFEPAMVVHWRVRETLPEFVHQYRRYGRGKAAMVRKNGARAMRLRHLAPPALVLGLGTAVVVAVTGPVWVAAVLAGPYAFAVMAVSAALGRHPQAVPRVVRGPLPEVEVVPAPVSRLRLAGAFAAMHLGWGLGFLEGLLLRRKPADTSAWDRSSPQTGIT
jgi:GT2 family glycosyltransferase